MLERMQDAQSATAFHVAPVEVAFAQLSLSLDRVSQAEGRNRLGTNGPNTVPFAVRTPLIVRFLRHFHNALIHVLITAATVTWFLGHPIDTLLIAFVVLANTVIGFCRGRARRGGHGSD
jgi:magnesium-transporting ATPase (P-type)